MICNWIKAWDQRLYYRACHSFEGWLRGRKWDLINFWGQWWILTSTREEDSVICSTTLKEMNISKNLCQKRITKVKLSRKEVALAKFQIRRTNPLKNFYSWWTTSIKPVTRVSIAKNYWVLNIKSVSKISKVKNCWTLIRKLKKAAKNKSSLCKAKCSKLAEVISIFDHCQILLEKWYSLIQIQINLS